jgi:hypothetical protein
MRNFMSLIENAFELAEAGEDEGMDSYDREKHVEAAIRYAFGKVGLAINYNSHSVSYEDSTREAEVTLEDQEVDLQQLSKLAATGLAEGGGLSGYKVAWGSDALSIHFKVARAIDDAQIPSE